MNMDYSKVFELLNQDTEKERNKKAEKAVHDNLYNKGYRNGYRNGLAVLDKLRAEIERQEKWLMDAGYNAYNVDIAFNAVKLAVDKYRAETED